MLGSPPPPANPTPGVWDAVPLQWSAQTGSPGVYPDPMRCSYNLLYTILI